MQPELIKGYNRKKFLLSKLCGSTIQYIEYRESNTHKNNNVRSLPYRLIGLCVNTKNLNTFDIKDHFVYSAEIFYKVLLLLDDVCFKLEIITKVNIKEIGTINKVPPLEDQPIAKIFLKDINIMM